MTADGPTVLAEGLLSVHDAARFLAISRSKLYSLMDAGNLAYVKLGRSRQRLVRFPGSPQRLHNE